MGMTPEYVTAVNTAWDTVESDIWVHGIALLFLLIRNHPDYQTKFKQFEHVPLNSLKENPEFALQGHEIISKLGQWIRAIDNEHALKCVMSPAARHHDSIGVGIVEIKNTFTAAKQHLKDTFGSSYNEPAWEAAFEYIGTIFEDAYTTMHVKPKDVC